MDTGVKEYAEAHPELNVYQKGTDQIAQGVDAICVVPVDIQSIDPVLKKAKDAGTFAGNQRAVDRHWHSAGVYLCQRLHRCGSEAGTAVRNRTVKALKSDI